MKKIGRPKKIIDYPSVNYSYILFDIITNKQKYRMPGSSSELLKQKLEFKKVKIKPSKVKEITDEMGHKEAHKFLKSIGAKWVCKNGEIFFEGLN